MKFSVVGLGYVGMSLATLLSTKYEVYAIDVVQEIVDKVNHRVPPIADPYISDYFKNKELNIRASLDYQEAFKHSDYIIIATPTDYNEITNEFDTSSIENVINNVMDVNPEVNIIIKSTIPFGYTDRLKKKYNKNNIAFSPEFLREGKALYDNLYPSRIIVGSDEDYAVSFANILSELAEKDADVFLMSNNEAESVKLFSNAYLALRVSYFNELDMFAEYNDMNAKNIVQGVSADPRIGDYYNNPSFGYGGYCLPKDVKQLSADFHSKDVPTALMDSISNSNELRKKHIAESIAKNKPKTVGVYKLAMKSGSDNFRSSSMFGVIDYLKELDLEIILYDEYIKEDVYMDMKVMKNLEKFKENSDIIITNRVDDELTDVENKIYSRDIFGVN